MGENLFTHAMSEAEVQAHEVRLKRKTENEVSTTLAAIGRAVSTIRAYPPFIHMLCKKTRPAFVSKAGPGYYRLNGAQ